LLNNATALCFEQTSAVQHENPVSLPVEGPLPEEEPVRLAPAANGSFPPLLTIILGNVDGSFRPKPDLRAWRSEQPLRAQTANILRRSQWLLTGK
jgi:hypothetical protein